MARFVTDPGSMIASGLLRLMFGTGSALQKLMIVRAGAYGERPQGADLVDSRATATALGATVWAIVLVCASIALA